MNTLYLYHSAFIFLPTIPMNSSTNTTTTPLCKEEMDLKALETVKPPLLVRQTNKPRYLTYENGELVDQNGNPTTPEQHNTTHIEILENIRKHRHLCFIRDDDEFLSLLAKYIPQNIKIEMPKLERTNRPKVDLGLPPLEDK